MIVAKGGGHAEQDEPNEKLPQVAGDLFHSLIPSMGDVVTAPKLRTGSYRVAIRQALLMSAVDNQSRLAGNRLLAVCG